MSEEWVCPECRTAYPAPPGSGGHIGSLARRVCPCGGVTMPRASFEVREAQKRLEALQAERDRLAEDVAAAHAASLRLLEENEKLRRQVRLVLDLLADLPAEIVGAKTCATARRKAAS